MGVKAAAIFCLLSVAHSGMLLQDLTSNVYTPWFIKPLMSLLLTGAVSSVLKLGKQQVLWACRVWPNNWRSSQETEETPVSAEMLGNTGQGMEGCGGHPLAFGA